jgi:hypothetical protein
MTSRDYILQVSVSFILDLLPLSIKTGTHMATSKNSPGPKHTALQAHVEFFDRDCDGIIWPSDTYVAAIRLYIFP